MTGTPARYEYRCRRCGVLYSTLYHTPDLVKDLAAVVQAGKAPHLVDMLEIHHCEDGGTGLADLAGGSPEPANSDYDHKVDDFLSSLGLTAFMLEVAPDDDSAS